MNRRSVIVSAVFIGACATGLGLGLAQTPPAQSDATAKKVVSVTHNFADVRSGNYVLEHDHARIVWNVSHHGYSTFSALFSNVKGDLVLDAADPTRNRLAATVDMNSVGTLLPEFDARLKGETFFNTAKYPMATFKSTRIERTSTNGLRVTGDLTFLGVTKPAILQATFNQAGDGLGPPGYRIGFEGRLVFKRTDFGMAPSTIGDEVTLQIEAEFQEAGAKPAS
jgi:polyisoprenoid-binding protein YceI